VVVIVVLVAATVAIVVLEIQVNVKFDPITGKEDPEGENS
jgi:hypothetical protein